MKALQNYIKQLTQTDLLAEKLKMKDVQENFLEIQKQFFCTVPLQDFQWMEILSSLKLNVALQRHLLELTVSRPILKNYPIKFSYQKTFLKHVINELEATGCDVAEEVYTSYCELVTHQHDSSSIDSHYRHYMLPEFCMVPTLVLKESTNLLSSGTTGLSSWQAGAALAEWCLSHASQLAGRCVLELGSGCGLTGLVAAVGCGATNVLLSDGHPAVLEQLALNVKTNLGFVSDHSQGRSTEILKAIVGETSVSVLNLPWNEVPSCKDLPSPDILLAADVVFDPTLFEELSTAILHLLSLETSIAVLACTVRNTDTLSTFLQLLYAAALEVNIDTSEVQRVFYYDTSTPVHIYTVRRKPTLVPRQLCTDDLPV